MAGPGGELAGPQGPPPHGRTSQILRASARQRQSALGGPGPLLSNAGCAVGGGRTQRYGVVARAQGPRRGCDRPGERVRSAPPGPARSAEGARFLLSGGRRGGRQERRPFSRRSGLPERAPVPHRSPRTTPSSADWTPWEWGVAATAGPAEVGFSPRSGLAGGGEQKAARRGFDSPLLFALRLRPPETSPPPASPPFRCG